LAFGFCFAKFRNKKSQTWHRTTLNPALHCLATMGQPLVFKLGFAFANKNEDEAPLQSSRELGFSLG